jgi:hypothetical protein
MANTFLTASWVARKSLVLLHSKAQAAMACNRNYESAIGAKINGVPLGTAYTVRVPFNFTLRTGSSMNAQNMVQRSAVLTLNNQNGVDVNLSSIERQFDIGDFEEQVIRPAAARIASGINNNVTSLTTLFPKLVGGGPGTTLTGTAASITFLNVQQSNQFLTQALAPEGEDVRTFLTSPVHETDWISSNSALYNPQIDISDQWREGMIASRVLGYAAVREPKMGSYTQGTWTGNSTPVISTGTTIGSTGVGNLYFATTTMSMTGWASGSTTLNAGDVFSVSGVFDVDPETKVSLGRLKQFVINTQISDTTGSIAAVISPCPISGGAYQNVSALPAAANAVTNAQGTVISATSLPGTQFAQSLGLHRDAILFACVPLIDASELVKFYAQEQFDGFSIRVIQTYDTNNDLMPLRLDTISGEVVSYPELGVRVVGT